MLLRWRANGAAVHLPPSDSSLPLLPWLGSATKRARVTDQESTRRAKASHGASFPWLHFSWRFLLSCEWHLELTQAIPLVRFKRLEEWITDAGGMKHQSCCFLPAVARLFLTVHRSNHCVDTPTLIPWGTWPVSGSASTRRAGPCCSLDGALAAPPPPRSRMNSHWKCPLARLLPGSYWETKKGKIKK